jgi:hypothetical protein
MSRNRPDYRARAPFGTASQAPFYCATTCPRSSRPSGRGTDRPQSLFCLCPRFWQIPAGNSQRSRASGAPQPACPAPVYRPFPLTTHGCSGPASPRPARSAHRRAVRPALPSRAQTDAGTLTAWPKFSNGIRRLCHRAERAHLSPRRGRRGTERLCGCVNTEFRRGGSDTACLYSAFDVACGCGEMPQATLTKRPECQALPPRAERHRGSVLPLGAPFVLGEATARTSGAAAVQSTRRSTVVVDRAHSSEQSHVFPDRPLPLRDIPRPPTPSPPKESDPVEPR